MVVNGRPLKRMKRRVTADLYDFLSFPFPSSSSPPSKVSVAGSESFLPFRSRIRSFLVKHAIAPNPSSLLSHLQTWQVLFRVGDTNDDPDLATVGLDVVEEDVARSRSVYCDQCRVVGWSGHPVCGKRYHFILKADGTSIGGYNRPCTRCGDFLHLLDSRCKTCNHVITSDDVEDWIYQQLEDTTHLLHGVVHANGYGHLLRVNGREGGSRVLSGCHIMDFWDRLCKALGVRKVSVMDVSKKYGMEYRLLHAITKGHPWYGNWGYEFGAGSFALTVDAYNSAVNTLANISLSVFLPEDQKPHTHIQEIIMFYQSLSERELVNVRDLFRFLMSLIHDAHKSSRAGHASCRKPLTSASGYMTPQTFTDVERVEEAMFRVLRAVSGSNWVSWRALRGAVYKVAPPDILNRCLKELGGKLAADGMVVTVRTNPSSGASEYRLEPANVVSDDLTSSHDFSNVKCPSEDLLMRDLRFFYDFMLHPQKMLIYAPDTMRDHAINSAKKLLDCKQFLKNYKPENNLSALPNIISFSCHLELVEENGDNNNNAPPPTIPPELIVLSSNATLFDLKTESAKAFQDVYLVLRRFQAEEVLGYGCDGVDDSTRVNQLFGSVESVRIRGRCLGKIGLSKFRMERGIERWTVDCRCGAKDDDGERMLACDVCSVWQHTRCSGIHDSDAVPARFVCRKCRDSSEMFSSGALWNDELA